MYTRLIGVIARKHGFIFHLYVGDTQLYAAFDVNNEANFATIRILYCWDPFWMAENILKLNQMFFYVALSLCLMSFSTQRIHIGEICIRSNNNMKNVEVIFDLCLWMEDGITTVRRTGYFHLKDICSLKPYLTPKTLLTVTHAFITSCIDYCNSLLCGIAD